MSRLRGVQKQVARSTVGRFLVVGGVSYLVNQAGLYLLYEHAFAGLPARTSTPLGAFDAGLLLASIAALEASILVRFALNDRWTFSTRRRSSLRRRLYESNLGSFVSPAISLAAVNVLTPLLGVSYLLSNSLGILLGLAWNWAWSSRVVWRSAPAVPAVGGEPKLSGGLNG